MASKLGKRDLEKEVQRVDADTLEAKLKRVRQITEELRKLSGEINEALSKGSEAVLKERAKLAEELKVMAERYKIEDDVLDLNVGGSDITTYKSTLCKYPGSMLEAMFSGRHPLAKKRDRYFIDRNPRLFLVILEFLRTGELHVEDLTANERRALKIEIDFFGLNEAVKPHRQALEARFLQDSTIVTDAKQSETLLKWLQEDGFASASKATRLYRGSEQGFSASRFHALCDGKPNTLVIVVNTSNEIFGGFTTTAWNSSGNYCQSNSWLFSLQRNGQSPFKAKVTSGNSHPIQCTSGYGPTFGGGHDLYICDSCHTNTSSYANPSNAYPLPNGWILSNYNFQVREYEVYLIE